MRPIGTIFGIWGTISFFNWAMTYMASPTLENAGKVGSIIAQSAIPWPISVIQFFSNSPFLGLIVLVGFVWLLVKGHS